MSRACDCPGSFALSARARDDGSAAVEFLLVGTLLTGLTLAVLQLALVLYVRNVVHDAAIDGAHYAALADSRSVDGEERARQVISRAIGPQYASDIRAERDDASGIARVTVRTAFPFLGLIDLPGALEVTGSAPLESLD